jgi:hypothetical protein
MNLNSRPCADGRERPAARVLKVTFGSGIETSPGMEDSVIFGVPQ